MLTGSIKLQNMQNVLEIKFLISLTGLQVITFSMGNKLTMGIGGRKDAFENKADLDFLAKNVLKEVVEDVLVEVESHFK